MINPPDNTNNNHHHRVDVHHHRVDVVLVLIAVALLVAAILVGGCAPASLGDAAAVPDWSFAGPPVDERFACTYNTPATVESGAPFEVGVTLENVTRDDVLEVVTGGRNFLGLAPVPECDAGPEDLAGELGAEVLRPGAAARTSKLTLVALAPGQAVHRRVDLARSSRFLPGRCRFHHLTVDLVERGALQVRQVRCQPRRVVVEVLAASRSLRDPF